MIWRRKVTAALTVGIALVAATVLTRAADMEGTQELTGTLKKVHANGVVTIGYRESSVPFSYLNSHGEPVGYSIDLGQAIVDAISSELDDQSLKIKFVPVTSESRIPAVLNGEIDLECGSTTNNAQRQTQVAFSPVMFVAGTKLLVKSGSSIESFRDLSGKTVVVTAGTTNEQAMRQIMDQFGISCHLITEKDHAESFNQLAAGRADAFAGDDVLLSGLVAEHHAKGSFHVVGDYLSYDPYGIMFRKEDPQLDAVVDRVFREMAASRDLEYTYQRWFLNKLPGGDSLDLPMSTQLKEIFRALGAPD